VSVAPDTTSLTGYEVVDPPVKADAAVGPRCGVDKRRGRWHSAAR
jgi:hypothetical protein